jgi:transcriptional regulator with XRE-family HTH domain
MDQVAFARFVRRAVDEARSRRGWTMSRIAVETGVGRSTLFRWLAGDCQDFPELSNVRRFCERLDIPVSAAFTALGVGQTVEHEDEAGARADMQMIMRRLLDPGVRAEEKTVIRDMLRYLSGRAAAAAS